jgi:hypothetical protein
MLKINRIVVGVAVLATTSVQVQATVKDADAVNLKVVDQAQFTEQSTARLWLDLKQLFRASRTFSSITTALSPAEDGMEFNSESNQLQRAQPSISGIRV